MRLDTGLRHLKPKSCNKEALAALRVQTACRSLADTEGIILLDITLVLMLLLSSSPPPWSSWHISHVPDVGYRASPYQESYSGQMFFIFSTCSSIKSLMSLLLYCRDDTRLVFTWGLPITGFVQRPFCPSFVGQTQDDSSFPCCSYSCTWTCAL